MNEQVESLAEYLVQKVESTASSERVLVGISGIPASGKSTFALSVVTRCNELLEKKELGSTSKVKAILVGLDGWHLTRVQLDGFPDPKLAHDRRGAHWTFDGEGYVAFVRALKTTIQHEDTTLYAGDISPRSGVATIFAPSFDHALKDPSFDAVQIQPSHKIVIIEGLYTFLSLDPWKAAGELLDERWFVEVDFEEATERLVRRHVVTGVAKDMEEAVWRAETNDMPNGKFIIENNLEPTRRIRSVTDVQFASKN